MRVETIGAKGGGKPLDRVSPYRLGGVDSQFPGRQVDILHLIGAKSLDAQIESEVRRCRDLRPVLMNGTKPVQRPLNECDRRQQDAERAEIQGLQNVQDEAHVVI